MKLSWAKDLAVTTISYLLVILFVYASVSKLLEFENFQAQIGQSTLISAYTGSISYMVLILEITISIFLAIPKMRHIGLWASFTLMVLFTIYIIVVLNYLPSVPCSCGGILEKMNWRDHLIFNVLFVLLSLTALLIYPGRKNGIRIKKRGASAALIIVTSTVFMAALYISSDYALHKENPFIRTFAKNTATQVDGIDIKASVLYFAGSNDGKIYLGDNLAPLHVMEYDATLKVRRHFKITLDREDFPFRSLQLRIAAPYFYLFDGTVPVVYKGKISDWKGNVIMHDNNNYFTRAEVIDSTSIIFRSRDQNSGENLLGIYKIGSRSTGYNRKLLQKQIDGFFDTDGMLRVDPVSKKVIYTYYYRNQFIVTDKTLNLIYRGKTIDTTAHANIKITTIKDFGETKFAAPPLTVNLASTVSRDLLFNNSGLIGRFESRNLWKEASIVDVYNLKDNTYSSSFYIYNVDKAKVSDMLVINNNLYVIIGHYLHKYQLKKGLAMPITKITGR